MPNKYCEFPEGFIWGAATSAYQIEGAAAEDGRGPSVWDAFARRPGVIAEGHTGDRATDHYHRFREDVKLMRDIGLKAYRFSISWSRIFPEGVGKPNQRGVDFYKRLIDELYSCEIEPWATLFHWDLPQALEDRYGGWESRDCAKAFADYAGFVAAALGRSLKGIFTVNEFVCFLDKGYGFDSELFAPGKQTNRKTLNQARHHALLGHGMAIAAMRSELGSTVPLGLVENVPGCVPVTEREADVRAAKAALRALSGMHLTPIFEGRYHPTYLDEAGRDAPAILDGDMQTIAEPLDFVGLNLYAPVYIRSVGDLERDWAIVPCDEHYPRVGMPWLTMGPAVMYWTPRLVAELWAPPAIYIAENGCAHPDRPDQSGEIWDLSRAMYLKEHLIWLHRAVAEGVSVRGYFVWSLVDNFEWAFGYTRRFGVVYVDQETLCRTPKLSAKVYSDIINRNAVGAGGPVTRDWRSSGASRPV